MAIKKEITTGEVRIMIGLVALGITITGTILGFGWNLSARLTHSDDVQNQHTTALERAYQYTRTVDLNEQNDRMKLYQITGQLGDGYKPTVKFFTNSVIGKK